jgi:hypothetical protein
LLIRVVVYIGVLKRTPHDCLLKYLYFAGASAPTHPCCILDENVALALQKTCGRHSLPLRGWVATAYDRYATLLGMWVKISDLGRRDVIERWLFEEGKRLRAAKGTPPPPDD